VIRGKQMTDGDKKELVDVLKRIEKQLGDIKYDLADIKREMPKLPYYGDLLQDIVNAIENIKK
jgi:regulator of replication initiation timing